MYSLRKRRKPLHSPLRSSTRLREMVEDTYGNPVEKGIQRAYLDAISESFMTRKKAITSLHDELWKRSNANTLKILPLRLPFEFVDHYRDRFYEAYQTTYTNMKAFTKKYNKVILELQQRNMLIYSIWNMNRHICLFDPNLIHLIKQFY